MSRVLVSTIRTEGGVAQMQDFVCRCLQEAGHEPVLAWYEPYSRSPGLSVPLWQLPFRRPGKRLEETRNHREGHAMGSWLPEFEFTHYRPTAIWREVMATCDYYLAVSGNCLPALPFVRSKKPFLAWVATPWFGDRRERVGTFKFPRRLLDRVVVQQVVPGVEKEILKTGNILALSTYTAKELQKISGKAVSGVLPMPIDTERVSPAPDRIVTGRVGFTGRVDDPRKNIELLLDAIVKAREQEHQVTAVIVGAGRCDALHDVIERRGLTGAVEILPFLPQQQLFPLLQTMDLFAVPSHQEGLCISALEAMASGCPVVSTRCGGPEEFVVSGKTGYLTDFTADGFAASIVRIIRDRQLRERMSKAARTMVEQRYSWESVKEKFLHEFERLNDHASTRRDH